MRVETSTATLTTNADRIRITSEDGSEWEVSDTHDGIRIRVHSGSAQIAVLPEVANSITLTTPRADRI